MHIEIKYQITVKAPVDKVWRVVGQEFHDIGRWASAIPTSQAVTDIPAPAGAAVGGRVCSTAVAGFNDIQETLTYYDEAAMRLGYKATSGNPAFVKRAENNWTVRALGDNQSLVEAHGEIDLNLFPGLFLAPFLKRQLSRLGRQTFEELKYYLEHDQPHPRKLKARQKKFRKTAVQS